MLERSEIVLKVACLALTAFLLYQCSRFVIRRDSLAHLTIPTLPSLPANPDAQTGGKTTNSIPRIESQKPATNLPPAISARIGIIRTTTISNDWSPGWSHPVALALALSSCLLPATAVIPNPTNHQRIERC